MTCCCLVEALFLVKPKVIFSISLVVLKYVHYGLMFEIILLLYVVLSLIPRKLSRCIACQRTNMSPLAIPVCSEGTVGNRSPCHLIHLLLNQLLGESIQ
jgi:hypothetical protein